MPLALLLSAALASDPVDLVLRGICDGSTAVSPRPDRLLVAFDEDRSLHSYALEGGDSLGQHSLSDGLDLPGDRELDLEASVQVGETVWWLGSHGRNRDGEARPSRKVLFTTNRPSADDLSDLELTRAPIDLIGALRKKRALGARLDDEVMARPPKQGGLNLEGLESHPDGGLLVGLRSPLDSEDGMTGAATVVRLKAKAKRDEVVFKATDTFLLDLDDRGIRSLARDGDRMLVLAGPVAAGGPFEIYAWDGNSTKTTALGVDLTGLNPEALVHVQGSRWLVLSDDGAARRADWASSADDGLAACKDIRASNPQGAKHPSVYARARLITLP